MEEWQCRGAINRGLLVDRDADRKDPCPHTGRDKSRPYSYRIQGEAWPQLRSRPYSVAVFHCLIMLLRLTSTCYECKARLRGLAPASEGRLRNRSPHIYVPGAEALTSDHHFEQAGFVRLLKP